MLTRKTAIKKVEQFAKAVKSSGIRIRRAVLFGSYAHGKPHKWSDIDVALVADEFKGLGYNDWRYFQVLITNATIRSSPPVPTTPKNSLHVKILSLK